MIASSGSEVSMKGSQETNGVKCTKKQFFSVEFPSNTHHCVFFQVPRQL